MESPLLPVILSIDSMERFNHQGDEHDDDAHQKEHSRQQQQQQQPDNISRDRQTDPPATLSPTSVAPTMRAAKKRRASHNSSTQLYPSQKSASFEVRDVERSAFKRLSKTSDQEEAIEPPRTTTSDQKEEEKKKHRQDPEEQGGPIMPRPVAPTASKTVATSSSDDAQPHLSPMRYYLPTNYADNYADSSGTHLDPPTFQYQYRGSAAAASFLSQQQQQHNAYAYPAGYYNTPHYPRPDPPSARGHPQYGYFQEYNYPQSHHQQHASNLYPSAAAYSLQQPRQFAHDYYAAPGPTPAAAHRKKDPPSAVVITEETKGNSKGELLDLSPSPPVEEYVDERKPPASASGGSFHESSTRDSITEKPPSLHADLHDLYGPIPFSEVRTLLSSSMKTPSPPSPSVQATASSESFDPFSQQQRTPASNPFLQTSPVVTSTKRRRGRHPEHDLPSARRQRQSIGSASSRGSASRHATSWDRRFHELCEFKQEHGHCDVPQNYALNSSLGIWVNKQRMEHKNRVDGNASSLNDERLHRLQSIGFRWGKRKGQASWDEKYEELKEYKARFGNCHVPTKYKENTALGRWVSTQRAEYKKYTDGDGSKTAMNPEKIRKLEAIGFAWFMAL